MTRNSSLSESVDYKSVTSRASELSVLNDEECKRILSVVERDFKLRQQEFERIEKMKKAIRSENERIEYLAASKEFNEERCIRCFKPFRILINPRESCFECKLFVCHDCSTYVKEKKSWGCKTCIKLKELEQLTSNWFYLQSSKKHKRCGSSKVIRELHKREQELAELDELDDDLGYGTLQLGSVISYVNYDSNVKRELKEYSKRLQSIVDKLQADLGERNTYNNHRSIRGKSKETLKSYQQELTNEIARARAALSGPLRRSNVKTSTTHQRDLQNLLINETEQVLQTNLSHFQKALTAPNSSITSTNFDQKLSQAIFDKCVSREIFQELPQVIDTSEGKGQVQRQTSTTSSLTSLTKPSSSQPTWSNSSAQQSSTSWEIKSRHDNIRKINLTKTVAVDEEDTEKEEEEEAEEQQNTDVIRRRDPPGNSTDEIQFDNGLKVELSSIDDENSSRQDRRRSIDSDYDAIRESHARVGDWQTNFTLVDSKSSSHSGEETGRSTRDSVFLTIPTSERKDLSPRIGDKPLEDLADDDLYADEESSSFQIPINTATALDRSQISENEESTQQRKLFPLPANLLLQNHSSCSFRRPSYTYESDNESIVSSSVSITEMKTYLDEDNFRMDPTITDPKFLVQPKDTTVRCGETAKFKTRVVGTEPIDVFWFRFGTEDELVNDEKYQLSHDDTYHYLKIYSTNKEDEGAYLCVIANDKAQNVDMVKLSVKDNKRAFNPPRIVQSFSDCDVSEGSSLTLTCKLDQGYPKARVLWYKENSLIKPDGHYKLYYYGDGQHTLHVDEATIEDDNGTFTCLALNAAGRVQITADVFVHEKEVINIPRRSPIVTQAPRIIQDEAKRMESVTSMDYNDHLEDRPPSISPPLSPIQRTPLSDNEEQHNAKRYMDKFRNEQTAKYLENWQNLYEASVNALPSEDEEKTPAPATQPFFLNRPPSVEKALEEKAASPPLSPQPKSNPLKPKWEIRLPQLLNGTVGPDRQKRDPSRRHTTTVVFQAEEQTPSVSTNPREMNPLSQSFSTSQTDAERPSSPLVKQLKQKFDRMSTNNISQETGKSQSQSQTNLNKLPRVGPCDDHTALPTAAYPLLPDEFRQERNQIDNDDDDEVASLTCRGLTSNNGERSAAKVRPTLPIRATSHDQSTSDSGDPSKMTNGLRSQEKGKTSPLMNSTKFTKPLRSTTSVVKNMMGAGATLVYDSVTTDKTPPSPSTSTNPLLSYPYYPNHHHHQQQQQHRKEQHALQQDKLVQNLKKNLTQHSTNNNSTPILTGRSWQSDSLNHSSTISTETITTKNHHDSEDSNNDETNYQLHLTSTKETFLPSKSSSDKTSIPATAKTTKSVTSQVSNSHVPRKSVLARAELWDRRISTSENDGQSPVPSYDVDQWSNEFEKIQSQT